MINVVLLHNLFLLGFLFLLGWAAVEDFALLRIPNPVPVLMVFLYIPFAIFSPAPVHVVGGISTALMFFLIGMLLFIFRAMGGGDVKLMAAVALWAGPKLAIWFLVVAGIAGGVLGLVACTPLRCVLGHAQHAIASRTTRVSVPAGVVPYGFAIAAGGAFVASQLFLA